MPRRLFALDQNYPQPIVEALDDYMTEAELVPVGDIDSRLSEVDDWEILVALHLHERPWEGMITTDSNMLSLPREMAVLCQTKLTLIVADASGHDPLKATGLLLAHLPGICKRTSRAQPQLWVLKTATRDADDPWDRVQQIAKRRGESPAELYQASKLSPAELRRDPLA